MKNINYSLLLSLLSLSGCAWWQLGINDPSVVSNAISTAHPYQEMADAVYPKAGIVIGAILIPLLVLLGGRKKSKDEQKVS